MKSEKKFDLEISHYMYLESTKCIAFICTMYEI